jgi:hypothetical protein
MIGLLLRLVCFNLRILVILLVIYLRWFCQQLFLAYHAAILCLFKLFTYLGILINLTICNRFCVVRIFDFRLDNLDIRFFEWLYYLDSRVRFLLLNLCSGFIVNTTFLNSLLSEFPAPAQTSNAQICANALSHLNEYAFNIHHHNEITMFIKDNYLVPLSSNTTLWLLSFCLSSFWL